MMYQNTTDSSVANMSNFATKLSIFSELTLVGIGC